MKNPPILPSSLLKIRRCGGSLLYGVACLKPTRNAMPMRLPAPKCVPLNGFPKLNAYVWSVTLFIQNDSAASARGPLAIVQVVTTSRTARGLTRPVSKSTVSDPGRPLRSSRSSVALHSDRRTCLVTEASRDAKAPPLVIVCGRGGQCVPLIVIRGEPRSILDGRDLVLEKQAARYRSELDDAGIRVADGARPAALRPGRKADVEPVRVLTRDAVRDGYCRAEEDIRIVDVCCAASPERRIERPAARDLMPERDVDGSLPLGRYRGAPAGTRVVDKG